MTRNYHLLSIVLTFYVAITFATFAVSQSHSIESNSDSPNVENNDASSDQTGQGSPAGTQDGYGRRGQNFGQSGSNFPGSGLENQTRGNGQRGQQFGSRNGGIQGAGATQEWNGNRQNNGFATGGFGPGFGSRGQFGGNGQQFGNQNGFGQRGKRGADWGNSASAESNDVSGEQVNGNGQDGQPGALGGYGGIDQEDIRELCNLTRANVQALRALLSALDTAQEMDMLRIVSNHSLSRDQLEAATDQWAAQQNETVQQAYQQYKQTLAQLLSEMDEIHNEVGANLTAPARAVDQQLMGVLSNGSLNHLQQCQQISGILANATQEIKRELKRTFGPLPCQRSHPGRFGGGRAGRLSNSDEFGRRGALGGGAIGGGGGPFGNNQSPFRTNQQTLENRGNRQNRFFDDSNGSRFGGRNGQSANNGQFGGRGGRGGNNQQPGSSGTQGGQFGQQGGQSGNQAGQSRQQGGSQSGNQAGGPSGQQGGQSRQQGGQSRQQGGSQSRRGQSSLGNNGGSGSAFGGNQQQGQGFGRF